MSKFLEEIKENDNVKVSWESNDKSGVRQEKVTRATKTLIIIGNYRFSRKTGYLTKKIGIVYHHILDQC